MHRAILSATAGSYCCTRQSDDDASHQVRSAVASASVLGGGSRTASSHSSGKPGGTYPISSSARLAAQNVSRSQYTASSLTEVNQMRSPKHQPWSG